LARGGGAYGREVLNLKSGKLKLGVTSEKATKPSHPKLPRIDYDRSLALNYE